MPAFMVVLMEMPDDHWIAEYFADVSALLQRHGGVALAGARSVDCVEDDLQTGRLDRLAVFTFPDAKAAMEFMSDPAYQKSRKFRREHSKATIYVFDSNINEDRPLS